MPAGEQVAFQPALAQMFAQHLHDAAVGAEVDVDLLDLGHPLLAGHFQHGFETVRGGLVRAEHTKIPAIEIELHHVAQVFSEVARGFSLDAAGLRQGDGVVAEVRQRQRTQQLAAIGMRVGAHASVAGRGKSRQLLAELAVPVEQLLWPVAAHPFLELL